MFCCCLPLVSEIIGWQLCSAMSSPDPASGLVFPLSGPLRVAVTLTKQDRGLQQYVLEAAYDHTAQVPLPRWALPSAALCCSGGSVLHIQPSAFQALFCSWFHSQYMGRYVRHKLLMLRGGVYSFYLQNNTQTICCLSVRDCFVNGVPMNNVIILFSFRRIHGSLVKLSFTSSLGLQSQTWKEMLVLT